MTVFRRLGRFTVVPRVPRVEERIDLVRRKFPTLRFDARGAAPLLEALQHYRRKWNDKLMTFDPEPVHDSYSQLAHALGNALERLPADAAAGAGRKAQGHLLARARRPAAGLREPDMDHGGARVRARRPIRDGRR